MTNQDLYLEIQEVQIAECDHTDAHIDSPLHPMP